MNMSMTRQQIGRLIHQILLREIGHEIDLDRLLADDRYARDVLFVCDACPGGELIPLAELFREASRRRLPVPAGMPASAITQPAFADSQVVAQAAVHSQANTTQRRHWLSRWVGW
jgi:hypothetical protein